MSIKPLDLQVNMNSQVSLSQQEAQRVASLNSQQKTNNVKSQKAGNLVRESVTESEQTYISTQQEKPQSKQRKIQNTEQTDSLASRPPRSNSIDFLA